MKVVRLSGRLDAMTSGEVQPVLVEALENAASGMILNLGAVDFVSSAGLRTLLILWKQASAHSKSMAVVAAQPSIYKIFKIAALDKIFRFFDDEREALGALCP